MSRAVSGLLLLTLFGCRPLPPPPVSVDRADQLRKDGAYAEAIAAYGEVLKGDPTNLKALLGRALAAELAEDDEWAMADYGRSIAIDPQLAEARIRRARLRLRAGTLAAARADIDALDLSRLPNRTRVEALALASEILEADGRTEEARLRGEEAIAQASGDPASEGSEVYRRTLSRLAGLELRAGRFPQALSLTQGLIENKRRYGVMVEERDYCTLALLHLLTGSPAEARACLRGVSGPSRQWLEDLLGGGRR